MLWVFGKRDRDTLATSRGEPRREQVEQKHAVQVKIHFTFSEHNRRSRYNSTTTVFKTKLNKTVRFHALYAMER
jgi:hypothetical protein